MLSPIEQKIFELECKLIKSNNAKLNRKIESNIDSVVNKYDKLREEAKKTLSGTQLTTTLATYDEAEANEIAKLQNEARDKQAKENEKARKKEAKPAGDRWYVVLRIFYFF